MILRTRFFSSLVSGKPFSVLRSQRSVSVGSDDEDEAASMLTVKIPPVTGIRLISPMEVLNVWRSSCANW
jgi:hypothetical protein